MSCRLFPCFVIRNLIVVTLLLFIIDCDQTGRKSDLPNIILIMADDMGWGDAGYQGNDTIITPSIDQLVAEGIRFDRFYAAAPVCSPTRGSCLTGRHPYRYGIYGANVGKMREEEITLAEALKSVGYTTGHFGKWHLGTLTNDEVDANRGGRDPNVYSPPWMHGFDVCFSTESKVPTYDPMITPGSDAEDIGHREPGTPFGTYYWTGPGEKVTDNLEGDDSRIIMDRVVPFIQSSAEYSLPFLTVIWFHTPHLPVIAGQEYKDLYSPYDDGIRHFYGCITAMDEQIGRLVSELKNLGEWDNTILFFTSDNGPEGKTRSGRKQGSIKGLKGRKRSLHEGGIRVPGIMVWPARIKVPKVIHSPISTSDYYPTILDILDIKMPDQPQLDGISFLPNILGLRSARPYPIGFQFKSQLAMIDNHYKIYSSDNGQSFQLFDIIDDPAESVDVSLEFPEIKDTLMNELNKWIISCKQSDQGNDYK